MATFDMCVLRISSQDVKYGGCSSHVSIRFFFTIVEFIYSNMTAVFDICVAHWTSDNRISLSLMAKKMAVFDI